MFACLLYVLYAAVSRTFNWILLIAIVAIFIEGAALILNRWRCPLTTLAERCGAAKGSVTIIFLPPLVAQHTFTWFTILFTAGLILLGIRYFTG